MPFSSKFRHVYGDVPKSEKHFLDLDKPYTSGEGAYCDANSKYIGVSKAGGGGPVYILDQTDPGRQTKLKTVNVHKGKALDFQFHPFISSLIGICSDDCMASVSMIPDGGLKEHVKKAEVELKGHMKRVHLLKWHPTANSILCTGSWDRTVKLWNAETAQCIQTYEQFKDQAYSMDWNLDGSMLGVTSKDRMARLFDPRMADKAATTFECMGGKKSSKFFWVPTHNWVGCTGFSKQAKRCLRIWDMKMIDGKPIHDEVIDQQSSVLMPKFDPDRNLLYMAGKGDGSVSFSELVKDGRIVYNLGVYRDTVPQKGGGWLPTRACDTKRCEVARFFKLTRDSVIPVSFIVPRKTGADIFQEDIYPETKSALPSMSVDEYLGGENKPPVLMSMDPSKRKDGGAEVKFEKKATYAELVKENQDLKTRIEELEKQIKSAQC